MLTWLHSRASLMGSSTGQAERVQVEIFVLIHLFKLDWYVEPFCHPYVKFSVYFYLYCDFVYDVFPLKDIIFLSLTFMLFLFVVFLIYTNFNILKYIILFKYIKKIMYFKNIIKEQH